jgi:POT family proton-dependent oligopeptide transporter
MNMLKNHPRGLWFMFSTEMWERIGFYTLMPMLTLYMIHELRWSEARASEYYGNFVMACYLFPLLGGWLGDRILKRITTVNIGAMFMAIGYVALAFSSEHRTFFFLIGLSLIAIGTGVFKVNMGALIGNLYADKVLLKDAGFNIFYMGVNLGALIAPLMITFNKVVLHSYHLSFWICAGGLLCALVIFWRGRPHLVHADFRTTPHASEHAGSTAVPMSTKETTERIITLLGLFLVVIFFWAAFYQNYFALTLFAERSTVAFKWLQPETFQFFPPLFIVALTPLLLSFFSRLNKKGREPPTPVKMFFGMLIMTVSVLIMVAASYAGGDANRNDMSPLWLITMYLFVSLAEILISPMGMSYVSKVTPARYQGLLVTWQILQHVSSPRLFSFPRRASGIRGNPGAAASETTE